MKHPRNRYERMRINEKKTRKLQDKRGKRGSADNPISETDDVIEE